MVLNPFARAREKAEQQRTFELRERDGDHCRRCRRPMRFDLPRGHDHSPRIEQLPGADEGAEQFLCNVRCHQGMIDHTAEVVERIRRKGEAELFSTARKRRQA